MVKEHPINLAAFVAGRLDERETQVVLDHLAICDRCLTAVDELWPAMDSGIVTALGPELPDDRADLIETRLVDRLHRTNLSARLLWFTTQGVVQVALAFLQPFLSRSPARRRPAPDSPPMMELSDD